MKKLFHSTHNCKIDQKTVDVIFSFLFDRGYLTISNENRHQERISIRIANTKVECELEQRIVDFCSKVYTLNFKCVEDAVHQLNLLVCSSIETSELNLAFKNLFAEFSKCIEMRMKNDIEKIGVDEEDDIVNLTISYTTLKLKRLSKYRARVGEVCYERKQPDIFLFHSKNMLALVVEVVYNKTSQVAYDQARVFSYIINKSHSSVQKIKYMGINITKEKNVEILCGLQET